MTNEELIAKIKAEIERRKDICSGVFERNSDTYYQGKAVAYDEALSFLSTLESEKPVPNDLEEAAWDCVLDSVDVNNQVLLPKYKVLLTSLFIAGAKWQAEQLLKSSPLPEDTVLFNKGVEEGKRLAEEEQADLFTIVALDSAQRAKEQMMENYPKWRRIKAGERLPCPAYVWTIAYDNYPDCFEGRLMPNIQGVKVGRDTWYLPVDVIHNLPKED